MNVLAVDGALGAFSAALAQRDRILAWRCESGNVALERGLSAIEETLRDARLEPARLDRLAIGVGPGGFTGLRIAIAYAKSLATVWDRPLVPISSFDLLEYGREFQRVLSVVVGRPGVISARVRTASATRRASGRTDEVLDKLLADNNLTSGALPVVGAPKDVLHALAERGIIVRSFEPAITPAAAAAALAAQALDPAKSPHEVRADYGELPAAKPPRFR